MESQCPPLFSGVRNETLLRSQQRIAECAAELPRALDAARERYEAEIAAIAAANEAEITRHKADVATAQRVDVDRAFPGLAHLWKNYWDSDFSPDSVIAYMNELHRMIVYGIICPPGFDDSEKNMLSAWIRESYSLTGESISTMYPRRKDDDGWRTVAWPRIDLVHSGYHFDIQSIAHKWQINAGKRTQSPEYRCTLEVGEEGYVDLGCGESKCGVTHRLTKAIDSHYIISVPARENKPCDSPKAPAWFARLPGCNPADMPFPTPPMKTVARPHELNGMRARLSGGSVKAVHVYQDPAFSMNSPVMILPADSDANVVSFRMENNLGYVERNIDVTIGLSQIILFHHLLPEHIRAYLREYEAITGKRVICIPSGPFVRTFAYNTKFTITFDKPVGDVEMINRGYADITCQYDNNGRIYVWHKDTGYIHTYNSKLDMHNARDEVGGWMRVMLFGDLIAS